MKFDEIKKSMDNAHDNLIVPLSINDIEHSHNTIDKIRKHMMTEVVSQTLCLLFFLAVPWLFPMQEMAIGVYFYSILVCSALSFMYLISTYKFCRKHKSLTFNSKDTLQNYLTDLKITLTTYKTAVTASSISLILPMFIFVIGSKGSSPEKLIHFLSLDYTILHFSALTLGFILLAFMMYWTTGKWAHFLYLKHAQHVEQILEQYIE